MRRFVFAPTLEGWQRAARAALREEVPPEEVVWVEEGSAEMDLGLGAGEETTRGGRPGTRVPKRFVQLARAVACHRSTQRWGFLYRALWRLTHGEPRLMDVAMDRDVATLQQMEKGVRRDIHKMRAFVRFREVAAEDGAWFVAWFEPEHHIVEANAAFFVGRFASMRWSILTPGRCAHWDGEELAFSPGVDRGQAPAEDAAEDLWRTYYASIFNPARVKEDAMRAEMPKKYWRNLPEAALIPSLLESAPKRVETMMENSAMKSAPAPAHTEAVPPATRSLAVLEKAAAGCRACPLYRNATQTVFGEGPRDAEIVLVGEQPGDQEDRLGKPFVGPAGKLLDRALAEAGIDRTRVYVTNAVKHFKWEPRGKRRLHQKPSARDVASCRPWMEAELSILRPRLVVALGATAAKALLGNGVRVTKDRGQIFESDLGVRVMPTIHPSALLRLPPGSDSEAEFGRFVADLQAAGSSG